MAPSRLFFVPAALVLILAACGSASSGGGGGSGGGDDGKYHPPGNGTHETEADACSALSAAQDARRQALTCSATSRLCPDLIQIQSGSPCLEYDQGSVQGCIDYYAKQATCDALATAIDNCVITWFDGTNGCP